MKKFIAKLGLFVLANLILVNMIPAVYATDDDDTPPPAEPEGICNPKGLKNAIAGNECIKQNEAGTIFISIIEEPLGSIEKDKIEGFEARTCYRKTAVCITKDSATNKETGKAIASSLVDKDSCKAGKDDNNFDITCKEVTVILSAGGTTMISGYIAMIYQWAAPIVGMICVLVIVISGLQLSFSGGDSGAVDSARKRILQSLAGLAVLFLSAVILHTVNPNFFTI